jgi:hypothetical protein
MSTTVSFTGAKVNNETPFCRVYNLETKDKLEKIFYKNRISFFVRWEERGFFKRIFNSESKERLVFVFLIHSDEVDRATNLVQDMQGLKIITVK